MSLQEGGFILSLPKLISKGFFLESVQLAAHSVEGRASEMPKGLSAKLTEGATCYPVSAYKNASFLEGDVQ